MAVAGPQPALHGAAHASERGRGYHALGGAADAEEDVGAGAGPGGGDGPGHVPVGDEPDAGPGLAHLLDQLVVAVPVQDHRGQVPDVLALGLGHRGEVLGGRLGDVDAVRCGGAGGDLLHVHAGSGVEHRAPVGGGDDRQGVAPPQRGQGGAVDGVHRDVGLGGLAVADALAVVEHRGLVLLALPDDDDAVHVHAAQHGPHGVHRRAVGPVLVAPAHPAGGGDGGRLGGPDQLQGQVPVGFGACVVVHGRERSRSRQAESRSVKATRPN